MISRTPVPKDLEPYLYAIYIQLSELVGMASAHGTEQAKHAKALEKDIRGIVELIARLAKSEQ